MEPSAEAARSRVPLPLGTVFERLDLSKRRPVEAAIADV